MLSTKKIIKYLFPTYPPSEKMPVGERLMLSTVLFSGLVLYIYLTSDWGYLLGLSSRNFPIFCPACGGTRALVYLVQGNLVMAWRYNQLFMIALPFIAAALFFLLRSILTGYPLSRVYIPPYLLWFGLAVVILFGIARNIPLSFFDYIRPPV